MPSDLTDDDVPALTGDDGPDDDAPDAAPDAGEREFEAGAPAVPRPPAGRHMSDAVRAKFAEAARVIKAQLAGGLDDGLEVAITDPADAPPPPPPGKAPAGEAPPTPAPTPPAAALVPDVVAQHEAANARARALDERERALAEREAAARALDPTGDKYIDDRVGALRELVRSWGVAGTDDEWRREVVDLVSELSSSVLGVPLDPSVRTAMEARAARRKVDRYTAQQAKREKELAERSESVKHQEWRATSIAQLNSREALNADAIKPTIPFLTAEANPGELVLDVIEAQHKRDGTVLDWRQAAKIANDYLEKKWRAEYARRAHLLAATPAAATPAPPAVPPSAAPDHRRSRTLTNAAAAAPVGAPPSKPAPGPFNMRDHRAATLAKFRTKVTPPDE